VVSHAHLERGDGRMSSSRDSDGGSSLLLLVCFRVVSEVETLVLGRQEELLEVIVELLLGQGSEDFNLLVNTIKEVLVLGELLSPDSSEFFTLTLILLGYLNPDGIHLSLEIFFADLGSLFAHVDKVLV
jgi:hypothetical protein